MEETITFFGRILGITLFRYFVIAGIPFLVFYIWLAPRFSLSKIQARISTKKDHIREILHSLQTSLVLAGIGVVVFILSINGYTRIYKELTINDWWYIPLSVFLSLTIHDTYFYWMHRLLHHPALFKRIHLVHHQSVAPTPWAAYSFNFAEAVLEGLVILPIVFLIPMHRIAVLLFIFIGFAINVYGHLGYETAPRWFRNSILFRVLGSSLHHNMHHSKFKGHYGLYSRFWDKLMKTELVDYEKEYDKIQQKRFGESKIAEPEPHLELAAEKAG
jgi:lathosterol oxidase